MTQAFTPADEAAIRALSDVHERGLLAHDPDLYLSACTDDITFVPPDGEAVSGREAARAYLEDFPQIESMKHTVEEVEGSGDLAFSRGTARATLPDGSGALFKWVAIHRRNENGAWKMARDLWSVET